MLILAQIRPGIQVDGFRSHHRAVIGLVSAPVKGWNTAQNLLLPFILLTLGLVYFLVNGLMLKRG
jgi:uncharacterized membrane protein YvlD (DUF360 family)